MAKFAKSGKYAERVGQGTPVFMAGVLEYLAYEILELASNKASEDKSYSSKGSSTIMPRHIMLAIKSDSEFNKFFKGATFHQAGVMPTNFYDLNQQKKKKKGSIDDSEDDDEDFQMDEQINEVSEDLEDDF